MKWKQKSFSTYYQATYQLSSPKPFIDIASQKIIGTKIGVIVREDSRGKQDGDLKNHGP